jgi:nickel/cobalt transporter (NiCoT) family protein
VIGLLNLLVLISIAGIFRDMRRGHYSEAELEEQLQRRGLMNRFFGRATDMVREPWQMYAVGLLFGLGFDTATEIALLAVAGTAAAGGLPIYAILCLPVLFAAGMSLLDAIDGAFMNFAYGWALSQPVRKVFYNLTITGLSVLVALAIGTVELASVLADRLSLSGAPWDWIAGLDLNVVGYAIAALFLLTWGIALTVWRFGRIEERWSARLRSSEPA